MSEPSQEWIDDCMNYYGKLLVGGHRHWCPQWDFLPIDDTLPEFDACCCYPVKAAQA